MFQFLRKKKNRNFWQGLSRPILTVAPMDDVTDLAFRQMFAKHGKAQDKMPVLFTEFVSSDGLLLADKKGKNKLLKKLSFYKNEKPIVAQIFGANPERLAEAAKLVQKLGFDGVDINMGCPDKSVEKTGAGAALINNKDLAVQIIESVKNSVSIPVSVKTRLGYNKTDKDWIESILKTKPDALIIHLRTRKEMSKVSAHWDELSWITQSRDKISKETLLIANGDIKSVKEAKRKASKYAVDGVMVGRGLFGNPLFFTGKNLKREDKIELLAEHINIFKKELLGVKSYSVMKKHFKAYISDFDDARALRARLMQTNTPEESLQILKQYQDKAL